MTTSLACPLSCRCAGIAAQQGLRSTPHPQTPPPSGRAADRITAVPDDATEARFARLEHEMAKLREQVALAKSDAAAARMLTAGTGRDVSEIQAKLYMHTQGLNALRETQLEQGRAIGELRHEMREMRHEMR